MILILLLFCFQLLCNHRRPIADPHPFCDDCAIKANIPLCDGEFLCAFCETLTEYDWSRINLTRRKRKYKRQKRELERASAVIKEASQKAMEQLAGSPIPRPSPHSPPPEELSQDPDPPSRQPPLSQGSEDEDRIAPSQTPVALHRVMKTEHFSDSSSASESDQGESSDSAGCSKSLGPVKSLPQGNHVVEELSDVEDKEDVSFPFSLLHLPEETDQDDIDLQDILKLVAEVTPYTLAEPHGSKPKSKAHFAAQSEPTSKHSPFLALSTAPALSSLASERAEEVVKSDAGVTLGRVPPGISAKLSRMYQLSTGDLSPNALAELKDYPDFMSQVSSSTKLNVSSAYAQAMEGGIRESLVAVSYMDAYCATLRHVFTEVVVMPAGQRLITLVGNALAELARRNIAVLHALTLARRDAHLWKATKEGVIPQDIVATLRHAPFLGEKDIFPQELIKESLSQLSSKARDSVARQALYRTQASASATSVRHFKRSAPAAAEGAPPAKKPARVSMQFNTPKRQRQVNAAPTKQASTPSSHKQRSSR